MCSKENMALIACQRDINSTIVLQLAKCGCYVSAYHLVKYIHTCNFDNQSICSALSELCKHGM